MGKIYKNHKRRNKILFSALVLSIAGTAVSPVLASLGASAASAPATTTVNITIDPVIRIAVDATDVTLKDGANTTITPTDTGKMATGSVNVTVTTNNINGYKLNMTSNSTETAMKHSDTGVTTSIASVGSEKATLDKDTWGWRVSGSTNYRPIVSNATAFGASTLVKEQNSATPSGQVTNVEFGASVSTALVSGSYSRQVLFTAVTK